MKEKQGAEKLIKTYMRWPVIFVIISLLATGAAFFISIRAGMVAACFTVITTLIAAVVFLIPRNAIMKALVSFTLETEDQQNILIQDLDIPFALSDEKGDLVWRNRAFNDVISSDKAAKKDIKEMFPAITEERLREIPSKAVWHHSYDSRDYEIRIRRTELGAEKALAIYLYDETLLKEIATNWENDQTVIGLIYLDNYEEAMENIDEVRRSLITALIDRKINKYIGDTEGLVKKLEKDKYLFAIKHMYLPTLENGRFGILEDVKTVSVGDEMKVTLSIGVGFGKETIALNYEAARSAIEMALGRGGDQAVVKDSDGIRYFGGKSQSVEKSTRVKARVKAQAFRDIIDSKDELIIMGHKFIDIDSFGAAVGIWKIAVTLGKKAHIVLEEVSSSVRPIKEKFDEADYPEDMFIGKDTALSLMNDYSALVVVDVNRPMITEFPELIDAASTVVVIDHHRQGSEIIEKAVLSYVEPYASSACEMVTELVQYISDNIKLKSLEADAMYGGIVIDTDNFLNQSGVRTFEAAAFLRKNGADVTRVRKLFRDSVDDYMTKADAIHNAEIYEDVFAITECQSEGSENPTVIGAKASNDLLDIEGIKASIVFTNFRDQIYISARSIDDINVQVMMEKLGGGGHRTMAGAQLKDVDMDTAKAEVKKMITTMLKKGEIEK